MMYDLRDRLTDEQWERIRIHFPEENIPEDHVARKPISNAQGARSGASDTEHWRTMAHAAAVLSRLSRRRTVAFDSSAGKTCCARC